MCGARTRDPQFVNDYSSCRGYLFCQYNTNNELVSIHQLMCPVGAIFNEQLSACDATGGTSCDPNQLCPAGINIMIADATDPRCRRFHLCNNGNLVRNVAECPMGNVFNRNFGTCTSEDDAPCHGYTESPCEPFSNGFYRVFGSCTEHAFCQFGEEMSRHFCPGDQHFNPSTRSCTDAHLVQPPCPWA